MRAHNVMVRIMSQAKGLKGSVNVTSQCEIHTDSLYIHPYLLSKSHNNHFDWIKSHCNATGIHCEGT